MRYRLGLLTGFAAGYVLGSKAGTERYEQIREQVNKMMGTEPAQQLQTQVRDAAERAGALVEEKATEGIAKVGEMVGGDAASGSGNGNGNSSAMAGPEGKLP